MDLREIQRIESDDSKHYFPGLQESKLYFGVALAGETGEICNKIKKYHRDNWSYQKLTEEVRDELADVLIYLVMLADDLGIDLEDEWKRKKEYNNERFLKGV